ncbi:hypothetical protein JIN77_15385 [Verrucomicrobiaceae bacterium R5-34]|uniref:Uncharacterized protein n=1 Tax=Oceaniferula flava TaxID=2800421 RepID=A0AAE2SDG1_9BACT|nr:hypothetical protein [Oceaniferula flavus]MBK1832119.1 hypothetical protein [Verrucomicrobiaceae bacterium R5-34]MBK1856231.1 hypothetical protein [Oceaniferula flavus]MBM1137538.1 hypothetical protein [Oceaniferula flavus]
MAVLFSTATLAFAETTPTILALGDSMTAGGKSFVCYREVLVPELRKKKLRLDSLGREQMLFQRMLDTEARALATC